jgi:hypothetical protein
VPYRIYFRGHGQHSREWGVLRTTLDDGVSNAVRKLGRHHIRAVQFASINDECAVANSMNHTPLLALRLNVCSNHLKHDNVVLFNEVNDLALYVRQALFD